MLRESHRHDCHVLLVTTWEPGKEEGVLWAVLARQRRGPGWGQCFSFVDAAVSVSRDHSVATSRASPTHLRDRTAVAQPKAKQLYLQFVLTGTECGFSVCNIHQKPKALQICLAGRVPFSRR